MKQKHKNEERDTIIVFGMLDSIHVARWMDSVKHLPYRYLLFPSSPHRRIHPLLKAQIDSESDESVTVLSNFLRSMALPLWILDRFFRNQIRAWMLRRHITRYGVALVHAIELQNAGYVARRACADLDIPLYVTNWGSDIYWFSRFEKHESELRKLMERADYYSAECQRDYELASLMGFTGEFFPVVPNAGGIDQNLIADLVTTRPSDRRIVLVKGYTNFVGRADIALDAIRLLSLQLAGYEVIVYSATLRAQLLVRQIRKNTDINIRSIPKKKLSHYEMISLFSDSRIYIGISDSDGISTSMLEAMFTGCFPIQTTTACVNEWIEDGVSGFYVNQLNVTDIAKLIEKSLGDDNLVDCAAAINQRTTKERLDRVTIRKTVGNYYPIILKNASVI